MSVKSLKQDLSDYKGLSGLKKDQLISLNNVKDRKVKDLRLTVKKSNIGDYSKMRKQELVDTVINERIKSFRILMKQKKELDNIKKIHNRINIKNERQTNDMKQVVKNIEHIEGTRMLRNNDINGAYYLINRKIEFTNNDIELFSKIILNKFDKPVIKITNNADQTKYFTLKPKSLNTFLDVFKTFYFEDRTQKYVGSDGIDVHIYRGIKDVKIYDAANKQNIKKVFKNKSGNFFKYLNKSDIDLTRYQIIKDETEKDIIEENCLIYALQQLQINEGVISSVKKSIQTGSYIKKSNLKQISEIINRNINLYMYRNDGTKIGIQKYGNKFDDTIELAIYEDHYFVYDTTIYSFFSIKNYEDVKDIKNFHRIIKRKNGKFEKGNSKQINSLQLIHLLFKKNLFEKNTALLCSTKQMQKEQIDDLDIPLSNIDCEQRLVEVKEIEFDKTKYDIYCADTETDTSKDRHHPLMISSVQMNEYNDINNVRLFLRKSEDDINFIYDFLKCITNTDKKEIIVYFHNLKYDLHVLSEYLYLQDIISKDGQIYSARILFNKKIIHFRDSYKLIPEPLKNFSTVFELSEDVNKKECIAYNYYKLENITETKIKINEYKKYLDETQYDLFDKILEEESTKQIFQVDNEYFNPISYYSYYCKYDTLVLCEGLKKFDKIINRISDNKINTFAFMTISSLTNYFMKINGAFTDLYEVCGNLRDYISCAITGGRVICYEETQGRVIKKKMADYDGVSLYPSAIKRLCDDYGLVTGKAQTINNFKKEEIDIYKYYVVTIKITAINKKQQMPMVSYKDSEGILRYTNKIEKPLIVTVDKYTLNDWIKYHKINYEILKGVYWNGDYNKKMGELINTLFNERLKYKSREYFNNGMQAILKLMMNSSYGKTIIKKSKSTYKYISKENKNQFINNYFNVIQDISKFNNKQYIALVDNLDNSFNLAQVGTAILSISKSIMNEVFDIANTENIIIYYTDTDSMHVEYDKVPILEKKFREKYERELTGKNMGQFHIDFELSGARDVYASKSIFLGKKCYIDYLEGTDNKTNEKVYGIHKRMKGINDKALEYKCEELDISMFKLYEELCNKKMNFCLNPDNYFMCEYVNHTVRTKKNGTFNREVDFTK